MARSTVLMAGGGVRASDSERERCVEDLREHFEAGRLECEDFEARVARATAARTRADLARVTADLPSLRPGAWARSVAKADRVVLRVHAATFGTLNGGLVGIWAATGQGEFWPGWVLAPTAAILASHAGTSWALRRLFRGPLRRLGELGPAGTASARRRLATAPRSPGRRSLPRR